MNRRDFLAKSAVLAGVGALSGCSWLSSTNRDPDTESPPSGQTEQPPSKETPTPDTSDSLSPRHGISFGTVVNAVEDLGMDPTGQEPIDDELQATLEQGNVLVAFPPGRYLFESEPEPQPVTNWGVLGLGTEPRDVRFVTTPGEGRNLLNSDGGSGQLVENVAFDYSDSTEGSIGLIMRATDKIHVQDVEFVGFNPTVEGGALDNLVPMALDPDGTAVVDGLVRTGPTDIVSHGHLDNNANAGCIWLGERHVGNLYIRNSHIANTGTNAIYASRTRGGVHISDSLFENNNQTSLRVGGEGSVVENCRFVIDTETVHPDNQGSLINPHGIIWETGRLGMTGGRIENCEFIVRNSPERTQAAVWADGSAGSFELVDCRFEIDADGVQAIRIDDPRDPRLGVTAERPWNATIRNVVAVGNSFGKPVIEINGRPGSLIEGGCILWSQFRDAIIVNESDNTTIRNINIDVEGADVTQVASSVNIDELTHSGECTSQAFEASQGTNADRSRSDGNTTG
ncbi:twin-arginine translocation signal domain-containing protein [Halomicroarcula sp. GCM10025324]|uniref:twin-arginine translocation signal domain-containing protein n=1 Tax=Haloarcula TaxID=2237 RepID=UPI0023E7A05C|nr:twin-arginine translocation signal domain-containing protein [Halomicroarcula sp. ZS-22-S1]